MNKISVIMPTYNNATTIGKTLDSILAQTHKNFEIIIVDDGSTDNSMEVISDYLKKDNRIIYLKKQNGGVSSGRNYGLKIARGDYIQFIDADDDIVPDMFEKTLATAMSTKADMVAFRFKHDCWKAFLPKGIYYMNNRRDFLKLYSDFFIFELPWNKLIKRSALSFDWDETVKIFEGSLFYLNNHKGIKKVAVMEEEFVNYFNSGATDRASCVNGFLKSKFWENKTGYWHRLYELEDKFRKSLKKLFDNVEDFMQVRTFDMAFVELVKLIHAGVPADVIAKEMHNIFNEPAFQSSVGFYGRSMDIVTLSKCKAFVNECYRKCNVISSLNIKDEPYFVYIDLFFNMIPKDESTDFMGFELLLENTINAY